jgi:predicted TPR repeat methyltransferase
MRFSSSGDLLADRRYAYGRAYRAAGDHAAAADLFAQAVELAPDWTAGWFALGEAQEAAGDRAGAEAAFARALALDPDDAQGVAPRLAQLRGETPAALPAGYVAALFDDYAPRFDRHLTEELGYAAPALILAALDRVAPGRRFARALDLGCGTGLMGAAIRRRVDWFAGVDLSAAMVAEADKRGIYDTLSVGDVVDALRAGATIGAAGASPPPCGEGPGAPSFAKASDGFDGSPAKLEERSGMGVAPPSPDWPSRATSADDWRRETPTPDPSPQGGGEGASPRIDEAHGLDLVLAADVLVYLGDLDPLFAAAARALVPDGLFAVTVERHDGAGFVLQRSLRYAHGEPYLRDLGSRHEFVLEQLEAVVTRRDAGRDVPGLLAILRRA